MAAAKDLDGETATEVSCVVSAIFCRGVFEVSRRSCAACRRRIPDYCSGNLGRRDERRIVKHVRRCDGCLRLLERHQWRAGPRTGKPPASGKGQAWTRWGAFLIVCAALMSLISFGYDTLSHEQTLNHVQDWVALKYPLGALGAKEIDWIRWLPIYRHERHYALIRQNPEGSAERLGTLVLTQRLLERRVGVHLYEPEQRVTLRMPNEARRHEISPPREQGGARNTEGPSAWAVLEQLPPAVSAEVAFSTRHFVTPRAMVEMLDYYRIEPLYVIAHAGESPDERRQYRPLVLPLRTAQAGDVAPDESARALLEKLGAVVKHPVIEGERALWKRRYDYVRTHGFRVYGVAVRGEARELLKLRDVLELRDAAVLRIDWAAASFQAKRKR